MADGIKFYLSFSGSLKRAEIPIISLDAQMMNLQDALKVSHLAKYSFLVLSVLFDPVLLSFSSLIKCFTIMAKISQFVTDVQLLIKLLQYTSHVSAILIKTPDRNRSHVV